MAKSKDDEVHCGGWQMMVGMVRISQNGKKIDSQACHTREL